MKRTFIFLLGAIFVIGCSKEGNAIINYSFGREFIAEFAGNTKTHIDSTGKINWSENDIISYYTSSNGTIHKYEVPFDCNSFSFSADIGSDDTYIVALYGREIYQRSNYDGKSLIINDGIPNVQNGNFKNAHVAICKKYLDGGNALYFDNVTSLIKFSLARTDVSYLTFTAAHNKSIYGSIKISFDGETYAVSYDTNTDGRCSIKIRTDGSGEYFISTLPIILDGFKIECFDEEDHLLCDLYSDKSISLGKNQIINLGQIDKRIDTSVKNVFLNKSSLKIVRGNTAQLSARVMPAYGEVTSTIWSTNNDNVASISENGLVTANNVGTCEISVSINQTINKQCTIEVVDDNNISDLSAQGTANCYIASTIGARYKFDATVKGNSTESVGEISKVKVLWESFGTSEVPAVGDIISDVKIENGNIFFKAGVDGNALIAAYDRDNVIIWSWHIWVCGGYDPIATQQIYNNNAGIMMDRNLGATSCLPGDVKSLGLLYQWGRKDPFLSSSSIEEWIESESTLEWPYPAESKNTVGTIEYSISHPTEFITAFKGKNYMYENYDWIYTGGTYIIEKTRWDKNKTMYDPCPIGWKIPEGGNNSIWSKALCSTSSLKSIYNWDVANHGMYFGTNGISLGIGDIWYPATGRRWGRYVYYFEDIGLEGDYWTCGDASNSSSYNVDVFNFDNSGRIIPSWSSTRANGLSVRCIKDN